MNAYPIERRAANRVPPTPQPGDAFGIRGAADAVLQHGALALAVFLLVFGLAALYLWIAPPIYRADTVIEFDSRPRTALLPSLAGGERAPNDADRVLASGEMEVLRSREMMLPAILASGADIEVGGARRWGFVPVGARHGVDVVRFQVPDTWRDRDFRLDVEGSRWTLNDDAGQSVASGQVGQAASFALGGEQGSLVVNADPQGPRTQLKLRAKKLLRAYEDVIERIRIFEPSRDSNMLRVSIEDTRPVRAAALLNDLAANYIRTSMQRRSGEGQQALAYLEQQLPELRARMTAAEDALRVYQGKTTATPFTSEADALLRQRADLERQQVDLRIKRDELAQTYTADHPELAAVLAQLTTVKRALRRLDRNAGQFPAQQRDSLRLQREVQASTQLYTTMLTQVQQLRINSVALFAGARQLDTAAEPVEPVRPKAVATLSVGAGLGVLLALASVLLVRALQPTVNDVHELEAAFASPPTLAIIPESDAQIRLMDSRLKDGTLDEDLGTHRLLVRAAPEDPAVESLRSVHLSMMLRGRNMANKVILITAPTSGTGKAFVAANLAVLMAEAGKRVLLIDADLRKPGIHMLVGLDEHAPGLSDVLGGQRALDDVIRSHASVDIDVILHGTVTGNPGATLSSESLEEALLELRTRYDHIVISAAALLPSGDAVAVGRVADFALLVVRAEQSLLREMRVAQKRLEQAGIKLEGILVNGVKRNRLNAPRLT